MQGLLCPLQPLQLCAGLLLCVHAGDAAAVQQGAVMHAGLAVPFAAPCSPCRFVQGCSSVCMQVVLQQCSTQCSAWADCRVASLCACRRCCSSAIRSCAACRARCAPCSPCSFVQGCSSVCMQVMLQQCNKELCCMQGSLCPLQPLQLCAGLLLCVHADAAAVQHSVFCLGRLQGCSSVCMQEVLQQCNVELCCKQGSLWPFAAPAALCRVAALCACRCCSSATWSCAACRARCAPCSPCSFVAS